ncbi:unnamed protein product [Larinioides sclopetarius]|uniref:Uncharacterized protein n=1 Tax=Larinioides sclopetarius TaxID=280406 RepID=A0AAV2A7D0_9ARAC
MSLVEDNIQTESEIVNVEDILANFFLKKIDMKGSKSDSDNKYKKKSKHKKHKSKKHKHKSSRRSNSSERRNSNSLSIGCTSSSEEKDIKRLKKIKKLDVKDQNKFNSFLPVPLSTQNVLSSNENFVQNNTSGSAKIDIPYGPSLELLLTGTDITEKNFESEKHNDLLHNESDESSHQISSISTCSYVDPKVSTSKESEPTKSNEDTKTECKEENVLNEVKMSSNNLLNSSKQFEDLTELKGSNIETTVKQESSGKKVKECKENSRSRSRNRSKHCKRSRSRSCTSQSRSRKHSTSKSRKRSKSRSRSNYRSRKERSYSRDHSKSRRSSPSKTRRSRSRNRSKKSRRSRSHSLRRRRRSRSWSYSKDYVKSRREGRRSRSTSRRYRSRSRSKEHGSHRSQRESSYNDRSNRKRKSSSERESKLKQKSRSKSKEKYSSSKSCKIDQAKIREIAEKNVLNMIQQGTLPEGISLEHFKKKELVSIKAGGKSVQELTDFCAKLSKRENEVDDGAPDTNDVNNLEGENDFIHHPFKLKEQSVIKLNIKNAVQIPVKTHAEKFAETAKLSSQFPVSSGNQHKQKELEWVPVVPEESKSDLKLNEVKSVIPIESAASAVKLVTPKAVESVASTIAPLPISNDIPSIPLPSTHNQPLPPPPLPPLPPSIPPLPTPPVPPFQLLSPSIAVSDVKASSTLNTATQSVSYPTLPLPSSLPAPICNSGQISSTETGRSFFDNRAASASTSQIDFTSVFSKKFQAEQKLQEDPNNAEALKAIQEAEAALQEWVNSCRVPGMFYGSTHVKPLPREQLGGLKDYRVKKTLCFIICDLLLMFSG